MSLQIDWTGNFDSVQSKTLKQAFDNVENDKHNLSIDLLKMHGASGIKYRKLINNLISLNNDARYLEIGCWTGSTACSAMYGNKVIATCIDNFAWNSKPELEKNLNNIKNEDIKITLIDSDFRAVDYSSIGKHNVYMFDGPHAERDQYDGVQIPLPALDDCFTLIVDDYNAPEVKRGTQNAIRDAKLNILTSLEIISPSTGPRNENSDWHFGYFIAVLKK